MPSTTSNIPQHRAIVAQCETYLHQHGDSHLGVGWPNEEDARVRYQVMLDLLESAAQQGPVRVLDFGCGFSHLYDYLLARQVPNVVYEGLDLSETHLQIARQKHPGILYHSFDVLESEAELPTYDFILLNGIFTQKCSLSFDDMWAYCQRLLQVLWPKASQGLAFNVMSKQVDWERDDLFHMPMDLLAGFVRKELTRHFAFRHDYGLYEYTTYLLRQPRRD
ncbi:class I SAM-dependent methyltransferase [Hymenobacter busanensis]|uniref:Class I SAM-dependent methyltransferase n=1 Tax=Hymenobacter busanensis TaxID=2607656 RepID=A0A7L4ZV42_9BACT|nr:class I SAM-dependent methyltransferase [Hymenobacter busanensis]KAA9332359.1 class I SAM-dependent methyltransferase [Hymenobacter busanensis]QHJ07304.1 methyltransferase [Hymenobacter busanensis]